MARAAINNKIYCANGSTGSDQRSELFIYDIAANSWTAGPNSPQASNYPAGTTIGGKLYMIGGGNPFAGPAAAGRKAGKGTGAADAPRSPRSFNNTYLYDPVTNSWSPGPSLNTARSFADAATVNTAGGETAVVVAGYNSTQGTSINVVERSTLQALPTPTPTPQHGYAQLHPWLVCGPALPNPRRAHRLASISRPTGSFMRWADAVPTLPGAISSIHSNMIRRLTRWTTKSATYADNQVNNMACAVLTDAGRPTSTA